MTSFYGGCFCSSSGGGDGSGGSANGIKKVEIKDGVLTIVLTDGTTASARVEGDSAYQSYLNTNPDNPLSEGEWVASLKGDRGITFIPSFDESTGVLSWSNDGGLPNPPDVDLVLDTIWGEIEDSPSNSSDFRWEDI